MTNAIEAPAGRTAPWQPLGKVTGEVKTAKEAIISAGLDWTVEKRSLFVSLRGDRRVKLQSRMAMIRSTDDAELGIVSPTYQEFQNVQAFEFGDSLVDSGEAKWETAGSTRNGKVIFATMKFPEQLMVAGEDAIDLYGVFRTSHDGSKAISVYVTPIRVACLNQMAFAIKSAKHKWSMQHTTRLEGKLQEARETLKLSYKYGEEFVKAADELVNIKLSNDTFFEIVSDLLPNRPKTQEVIDQIEDLYTNSPTNGYNGTAWGALNAFTEYFDHGRETRSDEAVFTNIMDGAIAGWRNKFTHQLLALQ